MLKVTRGNHFRKTIGKLIDGLFALMDKYGTDIIPDEHSVWYRAAGITKKTFNNTVRTYDNFLLFSKKYLLEDMNEYFGKIGEIDKVNTGLAVLMRFCMVRAKDKGRKEVEAARQKAMKLAAYKFGEKEWAEILAPVTAAIHYEYPFADEVTRDELIRVWAGICKRYTAEWADRGMDEKDAEKYRKIMVFYYQELFGRAREMMFLLDGLDREQS